MLDNRDLEFIKTSDEFVELIHKEKEESTFSEMKNVVNRNSFPIKPVLVDHYQSMSELEMQDIKESYDNLSIANIIILDAPDEKNEKHTLFIVCEQLESLLHLKHPLVHPLEGHSEAVKRFGNPDSTVKIYNLPKLIDGVSYREIAETNEAFEVHLDGLGSAGTVETIILFMDSAPLFGGFTFFYDMLSVGMALAESDKEAFQSLFLPNAFCAIRPRGKGAIKVVTPVFYIDEDNKPRVFFRKNSGEYQMTWREDYPPLLRAKIFLEKYTEPFAQGSYFVPFSRRGTVCISRNRDIAHGRLAFIDGEDSKDQRCLSRKWFMTHSQHAIYKHVPGIALRKDLRDLAPDQFSNQFMEGEWVYDRVTGNNKRIK